MVSKARLDLPDPESPVTTTRLSRGIATETFFRLWTRAPFTSMVVRMLRGLLAIHALGPHERQLLERGGAAFGGARRRRRLHDEPLVGQIFAGRHHTLDAERAREMVVDLARRPDVAGLAQEVEQRSEQPPRAGGHVLVRRRKSRRH